MSRDFILILAGGVVSLVTTLVVLFVSDYIYRRDELLYRKSLPPPKVPLEPEVDVEPLAIPVIAAGLDETRIAPAHPGTASLLPVDEEHTSHIIEEEPEVVLPLTPALDAKNGEMVHPEAMTSVAPPLDGKNGNLSQPEAMTPLAAPSDGKNGEQQHPNIKAKPEVA